MLLIKIIKRINSIFKMIFWKIIYGRSFKCGNNTFFYPRTHIVIDKKGKIKIGKNCFFNQNCSINSLEEIEIGDNCIFGENVCLYDHNHNFNDKSILIRKQGYTTKNIKIGNNCWVGTNAIILKGVTIGNNVVIGAGAIVTKSIADNSIVISENKLRFLEC